MLHSEDIVLLASCNVSCSTSPADKSMSYTRDTALKEQVSSHKVKFVQGRRKTQKEMGLT